MGPFTQNNEQAIQDSARHTLAKHVFFPRGPFRPKCGGDVTTLEAGTDATAQTDTYDASGDDKGKGLVITLQPRDYWDTTAGVFYRFARTITFPPGVVCSVTAETRSIVDTAEDCTDGGGI